MPVLNLIAKTTRNQITISYRYRAEHIMYENSSDQWRIRNRVGLDFPALTAKSALQPFINDEIFYLKEKDGFFRNWLTAGINASLFKKLKSSIFYRLQDDFRIDSKTKIWGTTFQLIF
jgi:hypothetical protein